jgi:hypothetical protein
LAAAAAARAAAFRASPAREDTTARRIVMPSPYLQLHPPPRPGQAAGAPSLLLALALRQASARLDALARRLESRRSAAGPLCGTVEFHADAGAPEGALYVDGQLVGWLDGVKRL